MRNRLSPAIFVTLVAASAACGASSKTAASPAPSPSGSVTSLGANCPSASATPPGPQTPHTIVADAPDETRCGGTYCEVTAITDAVIAILEKNPKKEDVRITFSQGTTAEGLATIKRIPWVHHVSVFGNSSADLTPFAALSSLHTLSLFTSPVTTLAPLAGLAELEALSLNTVRKLTDIGAVANLPGLHTFSCGDAPALADVSPLALAAPLRTLSLRSVAATDLSALSNLSHLESLTIAQMAPASLEFTSGLTSLQTIDLSTPSVSAVDPLTTLTSLKTVSLRGMKLKTVAPLAKLPQLTSLTLGFGTTLEDDASVANLTALTTLSVIDVDFDPSLLRKMKNLVSLTLSVSELKDSAPLVGLTSLKTLRLAGCRKLTNITAVRGMKDLRSLDVTNTRVTDLSPLAGLMNLTSVSFSTSDVKSVAALAKLTNLSTLSMRDTEVKDLAPLKGLSKLRWVVVSKSLPEAQSSALEQSIPGLKVQRI